MELSIHLLERDWVFTREFTVHTWCPATHRCFAIAVKCLAYIHRADSKTNRTVGVINTVSPLLIFSCDAWNHTTSRCSVVLNSAQIIRMLTTKISHNSQKDVMLTVCL